jgi:hypothetical protein
MNFLQRKRITHRKGIRVPKLHVVSQVTTWNDLDIYSSTIHDGNMCNIGRGSLAY